jgi:hypothetical protein
MEETNSKAVATREKLFISGKPPKNSETLPRGNAGDGIPNNYPGCRGPFE